VIKPSDAARILALAAAYDARTIGEIEAVAWARALSLAEPSISIDDAMQAVTRWYANEAGRIRPVHVIEGAHAVARDRRRLAWEHSRQQAIEEAPTAGLRPERSREVQRLLMALRATFPRGRPEALRRAEWLRAERRRARDEQRQRVEITGLGWCVTCYRDQRVRPAMDPVAGSYCAEHESSDRLM
jgi:hypothetical protein